MEIRPVAIFHSPISGKFGLPRQSGVVPQLRGTIEFEPEYRNPDSLRGLDGFDYIWLIWQFSLNKASDNPTVRPPRLGGNERVGVFASRSPFRPNPIGLSSVKVEAIDFKTCTITVSGADLADGTPIFDIKPYVCYCDIHEGARSGFVDSHSWDPLKVFYRSNSIRSMAEILLGIENMKALEGILAEDPRPHYEDNPEKKHGLMFSGHDIKFRVDGRTVIIEEIV